MTGVTYSQMVQKNEFVCMCEYTHTEKKTKNDKTYKAKIKTSHLEKEHM